MAKAARELFKASKKDLPEIYRLISAATLAANLLASD